MPTFQYLRVAFALLFATLVAAGNSENDGKERELFRKKVPSQPFARGMVIVRSANTMADTYNNLIGALNSNDAIGIVKEIDHAGAAASVNLELLPNKLVVFGNPNLGSPVMAENPMAGLDLPQKMLVLQDATGQAFLGYNPPEYLIARYEGIESVETLDTMRNALRNLASVATGVPAADIKDPPKGHFQKVARNNAGVFKVQSDADLETTWTRLTDAIEAAAGPNIIFTVDHGANSGGTLTNGLRLVAFGNPNIGTPLMVKSATAGIDLPLKILVSESDDGTVFVTTNTIGGLRRRHRLFGLKSNLKNIRKAVKNFMFISAGKETS